jgi:hypothetical protein
MNVCVECGKGFARKDSLKRHEYIHRNESIKCPYCCKMFAGEKQLGRHNINVHHGFNGRNGIPFRFKCSLCNQVFESLTALREHHLVHPSTTNFKEKQSAFRGGCRILRRVFAEEEQVFSLERAINKTRQQIYDILRIEAETNNCFKSVINYNVRFTREQDGAEVSQDFCLRGPTNDITWQVTNITKLMDEVFLYLHEFLDSLNLEGSDLKLEKVLNCDIELYRCRPLVGHCGQKPYIGSMNQFIKLLTTKQNATSSKDCFLLAVAYHFVKSENEEELRNFIKENLKVRVKMPMNVLNIKKFENHNKHLKLAINVILARPSGNNAKGIPEFIPLIRSTKMAEDDKERIDLLLYITKSSESVEDEIDNSYDEEEEDEEEEDDDEEEEDVENHYMYITNLSRLINIETVTNNKTRYNHQCSVCINCMHQFWSGDTEKRLKDHEKHCFKNQPYNYELPKEEDVICFKEYDKKIYLPLVGFLDFEASVGHENKDDSSQEFEQQPIAYALLIIDCNKKVLKRIQYTGDDAAEHCLIELLKMEDELVELMQQNRELGTLSAEEQKSFRSSKNCHICEQPFQLKTDEEKNLKDVKVRDHDHYTGQFLGAAHSQCNLQRKVKELIPIFCHNFSGYDSHFIMKALDVAIKVPLVDEEGEKKRHRIRALPYNTEKIRTLDLNHFRFLDSASFLNSSLDSLVNSLVLHKPEFSIMSQIESFNKKKDQQGFDLLMRKGVFPYEFCTSIQKLIETKTLPEKEFFFSKLTNNYINDEDYEHAKQVFHHFKCENMKDYMELYNLLDTTLLAEVWFAFREDIYREFSLDACHFISLPQLAYACMLKQTKIKIDLLTDIDMILFFEQNLRGGLSYIAERQCSSSINHTHNIKTEAYYIDANNLYGLAQSKPLPVRGFRWLDEAELSKIDSSWIEQQHEDQSQGYVLEVDLEYPKELHDNHRTYPVAPDHVEIDFEMLSPYSKDCLYELHQKMNPSKYKAKKLIAMLSPREKYVTHYTNLKLYLQLGLKLKRVHRVVAFEQNNFLSEYINFCTSRRASAKTVFEKNLFKLFSNACYGKFIEQVRKHVTCKIVTRPTTMEKLVSNPLFLSGKMIKENLVIAFHKLEKLKMNKAYPIGFTILERSKEFMVDMFYRHIQPQFDSCEILMTDTDSFILKVTCPIDEKYPLKRLSNIMDFSNYPTDHELYNPSRKNQLGYFKDECEGSKEIEEFVGIRSKCYGMRFKNQKQKIVCKGIRKGYKKNITVEKMKQCLLKKKEEMITQYHLTAKNHQIFLKQTLKRAFSSFDDKLYLLSCGVHSVPHGHYSIMMENGQCHSCK